MDLVSVATSVACVDVASADRSELAGVLADVTRLRRLVDGVEIRVNQRLQEISEADPSCNPEHANAQATQRSLKKATAALTRATRSTQAAVFAQALADGVISVEHLDAFLDALQSLDADRRRRLLELQPELVTVARVMTAEEFNRRVRAEVRRIDGDDGKSRLARQKNETGVRTWVGQDGMWNLHGRFDPETALPLIEALRRATEALFHGEHPEGAPEDPVARHHWFQAHALALLMRGEGGLGAGAPEFVIVMDQKTHDSGERHDESRVDCGCELEIPIDALLAIAGRARFVPVIVDEHGNVIAEGARVPTADQLVESLQHLVALDRGREVRHADWKQRLALRAMYRYCAIPGCRVPFARCEIHHIRFWEHGGPTDLANLLPVCAHHHDRIHNDGWILELAADRSLTVRKQGVVIMSTGPPAEQWAA